MTNEELAELIKAGKKEYIPELWAQTRKVFNFKVLRFYNNHKELCKRCGIELEDLQQTAYFALLATIKAFDNEKGYKFITYINFQLNNILYDITGIRAKEKDPLNNCKSLDDSLDEESDETLIDFIEDKTAFADFQRSETTEIKQIVKNLLLEALQSLEYPYSEALQLKYFELKTDEEIAQKLKLKNRYATRRIIATGLHNIARSSKCKKLQEYKNEDLSINAYLYTGISSFRNFGGSSAELAVEYLERNSK